MAGLLPHQVQWVTASPLWSTASSEPPRMRAPQLLCFESDRFMEEFATRLQALPRPDLSALVPDPGGDLARPLKLFQPAHGRFYLVSASLVCRLAGLPDHVVDATRSERIAFVLRRLDPSGAEQAWVPDPQDATRQRHLWVSRSRGAEKQLATDEELFPMFPVNFTVEGRRRRLLAGFVPTSSHETFQSAGSFAPADAEGNPLERRVNEQVVEPYAFLQAIPSTQAETEPEQDASRFLLLDLATFLRETHPSLWTALDTGAPPPGASPARALYDTLASHRAGSGSTPTWREALSTAWKEREPISSGQRGSLGTNLRFSTLPAATLQTQLAQALAASPRPLTQPSGEVAKLERPGESRYVIRCVYQRPRCGVLQPPIISEPTVGFTLAAFFDPDAPARPVQITLPVDTSIAGLRKFKKNVSFVLSAKLRRQMSRVGEMKAVMDKKLPAETPFELGEICSFSIPVITLCAFMVLMIFLSLLNIVFWWMPLLKRCLPTVKAT